MPSRILDKYSRKAAKNAKPGNGILYFGSKPQNKKCSCCSTSAGTFFLNCFYTIPIHIISRSNMDRFALSNGPFRIVKWAFSQYQTICIWNELIINWLRIRFETNRILNYIYINYPSLFLSNWFYNEFQTLIFQWLFVSADYGICYHQPQREMCATHW